MGLQRTDIDDSRARRLFPREELSAYHYFGDYQPIIDDFGDVLVQVDDDDYQGDTRVLLKKGGKYGFLNFGWGSCNGCDALQGCNSYSDVQQLIDELEASIDWFDTLQEAKNYICSDDRKVSYYYHEDEWEDFRKQVANYSE